MLLVKLLISSCLIVLSLTQVTKIVRRNVLLSRRKRYLTFPMGSNLVVNIERSVKAVMQVQPKGYNFLGECDVPFALPSDTRLFKSYQGNHHLQRRDIYSQLETALTGSGLNGIACVKRMICEAQQYIAMEEKSLLKDLLSAIFLSPEADLDMRYKDSCHNSTFYECSIPLLNYIIGSIYGIDNE